MRKNAWDTVASLAEKILPYGKISKSQVVEIAINRLNHQVCNGELSVDTFSKPKKLNNIVKLKLPEPKYVGTAITKDEIKSRNSIIFQNRVVVAKNLTLQQLGTMFNITRERVRQIVEHEVSNKKLNQQPKDKHASNN
jgi:hypothetical protein